MKYFLVALFLFTASATEAYSPVTTVTEQPYEEIVIPMDQSGQKQSYLGTLDDFPHLYEFSLTESTQLQIRVRQPVVPSPQPMNLILLSVNPETQSLEEIIRHNAPMAERVIRRDSQLAISLYETKWLVLEFEPGLYRLEVSTPVNNGPYELDFGIESVSNSYFGTFASIAMAQQHFGYSKLRILISSYVLYQIGILLLLGGVWYARRRGKELNQTTEDAS